MNTEQKYIPRNFLRVNYVKLGLACALCYMGCYTGKTVLSATTPLLTANSIFSEGDIGTMGFALFMAYGIGQLINGTIGDLINPKSMALIGLTTAGVLVIAIPFIPANAVRIPLNVAIWAVIGFFCSMLWGPLTKIIAENSDGEAGRKLMLALNASLVAGTMTAYVIATIVSSFFTWKAAFYAAGAYMLLCAAVYYSVLTALEKKKIIVCAGIKSKKSKNFEPKEKLTFKLMTKNALIPTVIYCMANGIIRNSVTFWIPKYLQNTFGVSPSAASAIAIALPVFNFGGTFLGIVLLKKRIFRGSEHILSATLFFLATVMFAAVVLLNGTSLVAAIVCLVLASASMNSVCNLIYAVYVFRFRETGRISTFTGSMDCSAYVAAAVGTKVINLLAEKYTWNAAAELWCAIVLIGAIMATTSAIICKKNGVESHM